MKAIFSMEIDNCAICPVSEEHAICNCDSSKNKIGVGVYCGIAEDAEESCGKKFISSHGPFESREVPIPDWCPFVIERYHQNADWIIKTARQTIEKYDGYIVSIAMDIIDALQEKTFEGFVYHGLHDTSERDRWLVVITQLLKSQAYVPARIDEYCPDLEKEDIDIINVAYERLGNECEKLVKRFNKVKKAEGKDHKPVLRSDIAVPMVMFLADRMQNFWPFHGDKTKIVFVDRGKDKNGLDLPVSEVEIHYVADKTSEGFYHEVFGFEPRERDYVESFLDPCCIYNRDFLKQRNIFKNIFGINKVKVFVNGEEIPVNRIKDS